MAITITLTTDNKQVLDALKRLEQHGHKLKVPLQKIGFELIESTRHRIRKTRQSPDGETWKPVDAKYAKRKAAGKATQSKGDARSRDPNDLLYLTGQLHDNLVSEVIGDVLVVGSPEVYAAKQQKSRQFIGISDKDAAMIEKEIAEHLSKAIYA